MFAENGYNKSVTEKGVFLLPVEVMVKRRFAAAGGFTLVELLVVITIIGLLVALLLPAVQGAREAARCVQCKNNIKQMATACLLHEARHGFLPTGGWAWGFAGEPDRGFDKRQPSGWYYNILPFIEQEDLHEMGANGTNRTEGKKRVGFPVSVFHCPDRRSAVTYPYTHGSSYFNIDKPSIIGRSDYAANSGDGNTNTYWKGPGTLAQGDNMSEADWEKQAGTSDDATGVIFRRSMCRFAHITDGESCTYLLGEKYIDPDHYYDGTDCDNDQGWDLGYDYDINRWTCNNNACQPKMDIRGQGGCHVCFGSAHPAGFHMAFCDGSVRRMSYEIDLQTNRYLGNRKDGQAVDLSQVW